VLRGPQGTLFGRNASGGAVQIITRTPSADAGFEGTLGYESHDAIVARAYVNGAVAPNLTADFAVYYRNQRGELGLNIGTGNEIGHGMELSLRTRWHWAPTDQTSLDFTAQHVDTRDQAGFIYGRLAGSLGPGGVQGTTRRFDTSTTFDMYGK